jgi:F0F1-type ATP synthase membrane subunit b/b'
MSVLLTIILLSETAAGGGTWAHIYEEYLNIPGFESWKFLNLVLFLAIMFYLVRKPLSEKFKAKREAIRAELIKAEEEKQAALHKLTAIEAKLAQLDEEKKAVIQKAEQEAAADKKREAEAAENEIKRLAEQADSELARLSNQTRAELRRFSAEESIRRAEEKLRSRIDGPKDAKLVKASISEIGGLN